MVVLIAAACDPIGRENGRVSAVPLVAPPRVSPVEIKPPRIDRSPTGRVKVVDPPRADATQIDVLKQSDGIVDILWVVDDSGSMANERVRLVNNFSAFVTALEALDVDYHMGVTSVSAQDRGQLRGTTKVIVNHLPDGGMASEAQVRAQFQNATTFPSSRNRWEMGLRMAEFALIPPNTNPGGPNDGFLRPKAALGVIVVTNEDDSSFGTTGYYSRAFKAFKGKGNENLMTFSIIGGALPNGCVPPGEANLYGSTAEPGFRYAEVATKTGGIIGSICDVSFEQTLVRIAQALNTLKRVFPLTLIPLTTSIRVTVIDGPNVVSVPEDPVAGWQYRADTNSVVFLGTWVPPPGSTVRIEYAFKKP